MSLELEDNSFGMEDIQNLVHACEEAEQGTEEEERNGEANKEENGGGNENGHGNGKLHNQISSIFHQDQGGTDGGGKQPEEAKASGEHLMIETDTEGGGGGRGGGSGAGLVDCLMSSLPSPLSGTIYIDWEFFKNMYI